MNYLLRRLDNEKEHLLVEGKEYVIGRKNCDIVIENDNSISRRHAVLQVENNKIILMDCGSKYHTFQNGVQLTPDTNVNINLDDEVQFGVLNSKYRFEKIKYITTASALSSEKKDALKANLVRCYGKYQDKWTPDCTHLTIEKITLTIKVLLALIDGKPFVTPQFWADYAKSIQDKVSPPKEKSYCDIPVEELLLNKCSFSPNPKRKSLFKGKVFVFLKENTKDQMEDIIKGCGGECISWEKNPILPNEIRKSSKMFIIMHSEENMQSISLTSVIKEFAKEGKRTIPLSEIALSVVSCSCERDCNPSFDKVGEVLCSKNRSTQRDAPKKNVILEIETQSQVGPSKKQGQVLSTQDNLVIPPSLDHEFQAVMQDADVTNGNKRHNDGVAGNEENVMKKAKIEPQNKDSKVDQELVHRKKRKALDEDNNQQPNKKSAVTPNLFETMAPSTSKSVICDVGDDFKIARSGSKNISLSLKKENKVKNPFASSTASTSFDTTLSSEMNKDKSQANKLGGNLFKNVANVVVTPFIRTIKTEQYRGDNITTTGNTTKTNLSNITWMSKSFGNNNTTLKTEDPELERIEELFKECVVIKVGNLFRKDCSVVGTTGNNVSAMNSTAGQKNFKRFRKANILHAQSIIVSRDNNVGVGDTKEIVNISSSDDDDEVLVGKTARQKQEFFKCRGTKKFNVVF